MKIMIIYIKKILTFIIKKKNKKTRSLQMDRQRL